MTDQLDEVTVEVVAAICEAWAPRSQLPAWRWFEENITLDHTGPLPGRYDTAFTPMVRWVCDAIQSGRFKRVIVMVSAQSAKTQTLINLLCHNVAEDPGPTMWVMAVDEHCEEFAKKRLFPAVEDCEKTARLLPKARNKRNRRLILFDTMPLMLRGSNSRAKLQSDPVRRIYCDERREWKTGAIDLLRKRLRTFHNAIEISAGTAGHVNDELHTDWKEGTQTEFYFKCLACGHPQPFRFSRKESVLYPKARDKGGLVWSGEARKDGVWNFDALKKTVRYECESCGHLHRNEDKRAMLETLHPVDLNPNAESGIASFHWNALAMLWPSCDWGEIVREFLIAKSALKFGNPEPLKSFVMETLGEPWEERGERPREHELMRQCGKNQGEPYERGQRLEGDNVATVITADVQGGGGGFIKWVVRQWKSNGNSRLCEYGTVLGFEDLRELQGRFNRFNPASVFIDSGFKMAEVLGACLRYGWTPLRGSDQEHFTVNVEGKPERRAWRQSEVDPWMGTQTQGRVVIPLITWSNPTFKDRLLLYVAMGTGPKWLLPDDVGRDYLEEMQSNERREIKDPRGVSKHVWVKTATDDWLDCELEQLVVADAGGIHIELQEQDKA